MPPVLAPLRVGGPFRGEAGEVSLRLHPRVGAHCPVVEEGSLAIDFGRLLERREGGGGGGGLCLGGGEVGR